MAQKRMFSLQIVDSDAFLDMPVSSQLLYFHLSMRADDEGFIGNPKRIIRTIGASDDDFKILLAKRFLLPFESGVVVIKHWLIHNTIRMDRFNATAYQEEKKQLTVKENKAYTIGISTGNQVATSGQPEVTQLATQVKLSKVKLSKDSIGDGAKAPAKKYTYTDDDLRVVDLFVELIKKNYPDWQMIGSRESWADHINKLHRLDGRTYQQIEYMVKWVQHDDFWKQNVLSAAKLRQKFNDLIPKVQASATKHLNSKPKMI